MFGLTGEKCTDVLVIECIGVVYKYKKVVSLILVPFSYGYMWSI